MRDVRNSCDWRNCGLVLNSTDVTQKLDMPAMHEFALHMLGLQPCKPDTLPIAYQLMLLQQTENSLLAYCKNLDWHQGYMR